MPPVPEKECSGKTRWPARSGARRMYSSVRTGRTAFWNVPPGCWYPAADWCILPVRLHLRRMKAVSAVFWQSMRNSRSFPLIKKHWGSRRAVTAFRVAWRTRRRVSKAPCACGPISYVARGIMPQYYRKRESFRKGISRCAQREQKKESPQRTLRRTGRNILLLQKRLFRRS